MNNKVVPSSITTFPFLPQGKQNACLVGFPEGQRGKARTEKGPFFSACHPCHLPVYGSGKTHTSSLAQDRMLASGQWEEQLAN